MAINTIEYQVLPNAEFDRIQPLWEKLNRHHYEQATDFKRDFAQMTFETRKHKLFSGKKEIRVIIAQNTNDALVVGYCIASVVHDGLGEIDSIYIEAECRGMGIGRELMKRALQWLEANQVKEIGIAVAVGNEAALPFYAQFGFGPRTYILKQKPI